MAATQSWSIFPRDTPAGIARGAAQHATRDPDAVLCRQSHPRGSEAVPEPPMRLHPLAPEVKCPVCGDGLTFIRVRKFGDLYQCKCRRQVIHYVVKRTKTWLRSHVHLWDVWRVDRMCCARGEGMSPPCNHRATTTTAKEDDTELVVGNHRGILCLPQIPSAAGGGRCIAAANQMFGLRYARRNGEAREIDASVGEQRKVSSCRAAKIGAPSLDGNCGEDCCVQAARRS